MTIEEELEHLRLKLRMDIADAKRALNMQVPPDDVWDDEKRRQEWLIQDVAQRKYAGDRLRRLQRVHDRCFPKAEWILAEIKSIYDYEDMEPY